MTEFSGFTRREFLVNGGLAATGMSLGADRLAAEDAPELDPSKLQSFVDPLPIPVVARAVGTAPNPEKVGETVPRYRVPMREVRVKVHRDLPATRMWSFGDSFPGPTIETESAQGVVVEWVNELPARHFLPIDHNLHGADRNTPEVRAVVHLHGGRTPPESDGYPEDWITPGKTQTCFYPCAQHAAQLFYHDHTMGINRLNIYAGMQGFFLIRDPRENALGLPSGKYEIPLLVADRVLTTDGQLSYPVSEFPDRPWVPEVFGNAILVNGKLLPFHEVEPRKYRLRIMNGSNGRFYRFSLSNKAELHVIANDQGLLEAPVAVRRIPLAPAERADIVVDFAPMAGSAVNLVSDSLQLMQFKVAKESGTDTSSLPKVLHANFPRLAESTAVRTRRLTLDENMDGVARSMGMLLNNTPWHAPVTEKPLLNSTEIWELVNLTEDSHPIHLHLVRFQILDRRPIDSFAYRSKGTLKFIGATLAPEPFERGWKDTVRTDPGAVTRIIVPFEGYAGRYVWHCHILEHEDNEMMRPFEVVKANPS
jgi:spore coat protein A